MTLESTPITPKPRRWPWIVAIAVALLAGIGIGSAGQDSSEPTASTTVTPSSAPETTESQPNPEPDPAEDEPKPEPEEPTYGTPTKDNLTLTVKTLEKKCFGSAGCNLDFRIEVGYDGEPLDPSVTYEITYEIKGGEDPYINTLTVTGEEYSTDEIEFIGTASSDTKIKAVVTDIGEF